MKGDRHFKWIKLVLTFRIYYWYWVSSSCPIRLISILPVLLSVLGGWTIWARHQWDPLSSGFWLGWAIRKLQQKTGNRKLPLVGQLWPPACGPEVSAPLKALPLQDPFIWGSTNLLLPSSLQDKGWLIALPSKLKGTSLASAIPRQIVIKNFFIKPFLIYSNLNMTSVFCRDADWSIIPVVL